MRNLMKALAVAVALAIAAPAAAQYTFSQPGQPAPEPVKINENVLRLNLGVDFMTTGGYCYYYYYGYSCSSWSYGYTGFIVGPQVDFGLGGPNAISVGMNFIFGSLSYTPYQGLPDQSKSITVYEPTVDYVLRFGGPMQPSLGRMRIGGQGWFTSEGGSGGGFRIGGGGSFLNDNKVGIGVDVVLEGGWIRGYWVSSIQLMVAPELHF
jgi:hypothetical protein